MNLLEEFLKKKTIKDVQKRVSGEVFEYATEHATYFYGNCELVIVPADDSKEESLYVVDTYGDKSFLVEH